MSTVAVIILSIFGFSLLLIAIALVVLGSQTLVETARTKEAWLAFAGTIGGQLDEGRAGRVDTIRADIDGWPAHIDNAIASSHGRLINYTRMRVFYRTCRVYEVSICNSDAVSDIPINNRLNPVDAAPFGLGDNILLHTNDVEMTRLFLSSEISQLVAGAKMIDLQVRRRRNWKDGGVSSSIYEVYLQYAGSVASVDELSAMWRTMKACLIQLHHLGIAGYFAD